MLVKFTFYIYAQDVLHALLLELLIYLQTVQLIMLLFILILSQQLFIIEKDQRSVHRTASFPLRTCYFLWFS